MVNILIQGIKDGKHEIDFKVAVNEVPEIGEEFFGDIHIIGTLKKFGNHYSIKGIASCFVKLSCDLSLEEYVEKIEINLNLEYNSKLDYLSNYENLTSDKINEKQLKVDDTYIDISKDLRDCFSTNMPMKRIAPKNRGKDFNDIYPEYSAKSQENKDRDNIDDPWSLLKDLKNN